MPTPALIENTTFLLPHHAVRVDEVQWSASERVRLVRDDLLHPVAGGNKARKLDALLPALQAAGVTDVVTCGGAQSSHCAATAALAAGCGMRAHLLLRGEPPETVTGYTLLSMTFGEVTWVDRDRYADREGMLEHHRARLAAGGRRVAVIPEGARCVDALPGLIRLVWGLALTLDRPHRTPWRVVVDSGTGTTATGLAIGAALLDLPWEIYGVRLVQDTEDELRRTEQELVLAFEARHGALPRRPSVLWAERAPARRFGQADPADLEGCIRTARRTGVLFDPLYTWAAWQFPASFSSRHLRHTVVVHTGGQLNLFGVAQRIPYPSLAHE